MHATVPIRELSNAIASVCSGVKSHSHQCSSWVKIGCGAGFGTLRVTATDLDYWSTETCVGAKSDLAGECVLNAAMLQELLGSLQGSEVALKLSGEKLSLKTIGQTVTLSVLLATEFPAPLTAGDLRPIHCDLSAAKRITPALPATSGRPELYGMLIVPQEDKLLCCACDGYSFATITTPFTSTEKFSERIFIPAPSVSKACSLGEVSLAQSERCIHLINQRSNTLIKRLASAPADMPSALAKLTYPAEALFDREELAATVASAHCLRDTEKQEFATIEFTAGKNQMTLAAATDRGSFSNVIPCRTTGDWAAWGSARFPSDKLLRWLRSGGNAVTLSAGDPKFAIRFTDDNFSVYVMPMRLT
jgi:DNA polymerase III sliding clamp (beta) subunit (PCNA family)